MIHWIVFSTLATGLFYGLYCLTFRRDRWLQLSRVYLIITLAFSLGYPLVKMPKMVEMSEFTMTYTLPLVSFEPSATSMGGQMVDSPNIIDWSWWLTTIYLIGIGGTLLILLIQVGLQTARLYRKPKIMYLDDETEPYSFFNHIIIGTRAMSEEELRLVLAHESEHVRQRHTLDVLLMRLMCCVAWFNPFAWLMLYELRAVHEYQADAAVQTGKVYLRLLYKQTTGFGYGHITNNFNSINIKKHITMMKQTKSRFGAWKALAALPVAVALMMVGCQNAPLAGDTLDTPKYNVPDGSYLVSDGSKVSYVDVFKDGHLVSRHLNGMVEIPLDKIGEMDILYDTSSFAIVDKAAEKHKEYKYVRVTRLKDMAEPPDVVTDYYELCYSNDSTCQVAREINGESISTLPTYMGGEEAMYKYISENLHYPEQAKADGIAGRVHVSFVIEKDGSVTDVEVKRGIGHGCDEEAVRVVKSMPRWTPGTLFGKPVRVQYTIPFVFKLQ